MPIGTYSSFPYQYRRPRLETPPSLPQEEENLTGISWDSFFVPQMYLVVGTDALVCLPELPYVLVKFAFLCGPTRESVPTL